MRLSDLCPFPIFINWEGTYIELKPFSLRAITWAERFFFNGSNGFERMNSILRNEEGEEIYYNSLIDIVFYLAHEGFEDVGMSSPCILKKKISESAEKYEILLKFKNGVESVLLNSFPENLKRPEFKGGKRFDDLNGKKGINRNSDSENWEQVYIEFYKAGGMSIDQFMNLTMKQIGPILQEINYKRIEDFNILCDLINKKIAIKKPHRKPPETEFTKEDVQTFEKMHAKLVEQSRIN